MKQAYLALLVVGSFALGAALVWVLQDRQPATARAEDPFTELARLHREMRENLFAPLPAPVVPGLGTLGAGGTWPLEQLSLSGSGDQLALKEDDAYVFYELDLDGREVSHVDVTTEAGYLTIDAELETRTDTSYSASRLSRTMPIPATARADTLEILDEGDHIIIRMEKV